MISSLSFITKAFSTLYPLTRTYTTTPQKDTPISFLLKSFLLPTIRISNEHTQHPSSLYYLLKQQISAAPLFYNRAPVVLDFEDVDKDVGENGVIVELLVEEVKKLNLIPVGMTYTQNTTIQNIASKHKMALLNSARTRGRSGRLGEAALVDTAHAHQIHHSKSDKVIARSMSSSKNSSNTAEDSAYIPPLIVKSSVRSGHQVYARNGADLVVMGSVHSGAEVLADRNIHIYGTLKGRALAGLSGSAHARIFVGRFDAELVSISDAYLVCETQPVGANDAKPTVVWLEEGKLTFASMDLL